MENSEVFTENKRVWTADEIRVSLLGQGRVVDFFILIRYMYRNGQDLVNNAQYEKVEKFCKEKGLAKEYLARTYDDDPIPKDLLREFNLETHIPFNVEERQELYKLLNEDKSLSIEAVTGFRESWSFVQEHPGQRFVRSIKADGIFTKEAWTRSNPEDLLEFKVGLSRGRTGESWDMTDTLAMLFPRFVDAEGVEELKIYAEAFATSESLEYLREKYDPSKYKTEKSVAISMLRVMHDKEDYKHLRVLVHQCDGLGTTTLSGTFEKLKEMGFETVPYVVIEWEDIPKTFEEFVPWMQKELDHMWQMGFGIPSDGMVLEIDDLNYTGTIKGQYSSRNIALKMEHWSFNYYPATVTNIIENQKRVWGSTRVTIEPVFANDRTRATVINCFNPDILFENGINVDSRIYFERNSGAVNILIHGDRLEAIDLGSSVEE